MKFSKTFVYAMLPVAGLLVATVAAGHTLTAYMDVNGGFPDGSSFLGCVNREHGGYIYAEAHGFDKNNKSVCSISTKQTGTGFSQTTTTNCDNAVYHRVLTYMPIGGPGAWGNVSNTNGTAGWDSTGSPNYFNTSYSFYPDQVWTQTQACVSDIQVRGWSLGSQ